MVHRVRKASWKAALVALAAAGLAQAAPVPERHFLYVASPGLRNYVIERPRLVLEPAPGSAAPATASPGSDAASG